MGPLVDATKVDKILGNLEARGVTIVRGDKAAAILDDIGAGAAYAPMFGKPHLFFNGTVTRGQLVEELLHHGQSLRRKHAPVFDSIASKRQTIMDEIQAQTYMVNHAVRKGWTRAEIEFYQNQQRLWLIELVKFNRSVQ